MSLRYSTQSKVLLGDITELDELVELFLSRHKSIHTQRAYASIYKELLRYLRSESYEVLSSLSRAQAMRFVRELRAREGQKGRRFGQPTVVCESTVRRKHVVLKSLCKFLVTEGLLEKNPFDFPMIVAELEPEKRPTESLKPEEVERLLNAPSEHTKEGLRDRAILACLFGSGGRRGEISQICIGHVYDHGQGLCSYDVLSTKGGSLQTRHLPDWAAQRALEYYYLRLDEAEQHHPLFVRYIQSKPQEKPLRGQWVLRMFKKHCANVGLDPKKYSPHSARATVVTLLRNQGMDDYSIMQVTGHKSRVVLDRYDKRFREKNTEHPALKISYK